jgi:Transcriptional regulator of RNA polII, SAGA, subunit
MAATRCGYDYNEQTVCDVPTERTEKPICRRFLQTYTADVLLVVVYRPFLSVWMNEPAFVASPTVSCAFRRLQIHDSNMDQVYRTVRVELAPLGLIKRSQTVGPAMLELAFISSKAPPRCLVVAACPARSRGCWSLHSTSTLAVSKGLGSEMSLSSTSTIKSQLATSLGPKAAPYFDTLKQFISGRISRSEFDESVRQSLDAPNLGTYLCSHSLASTELTTISAQYNSTMPS